MSKGDSYPSSSSFTSAAASISMTMPKFCSSGGASCLRYRTNACSSAVSDFCQKGSEDCAPGGVVDWMRVSISRSTSLSSRT